MKINGTILNVIYLEAFAALFGLLAGVAIACKSNAPWIDILKSGLFGSIIVPMILSAAAVFFLLWWLIIRITYTTIKEIRR